MPNTSTTERLLKTIAKGQEPSHVMLDWRNHVLNTFLPLASLAIFPSVVQTVLQWLKHPEIAWQGVAIYLFFYIVLLYITFRRALGPGPRSWIVVTLTYLTGLVSMARGGLAGDGTIYLTVLPILATTLINVRAGIFATGVSLSTFVVFGVLANAGILKRWLIIFDNPQTPDQWLYFGLVMGTMTIITVFVVIRFAKFQMKTLKSVQEVSLALESVNKQLEEKVRQRTEELSSANQHLQFLATHDTLTGLPNRVLFFDRLDQTIKKSRRQKQKFALFFIDLDDFKRINDSYGHQVGDQVLRTVGNYLEGTLRDSDTVARLAGDEFTIILDNIHSADNIETIASKTLEAVSQPIQAPDGTIVMTISLGISLFPEDGGDAETLLRKADTAMYSIKDQTKNSYRFYSESED